MKNMLNLMKQAKELQSKMEDLQKNIDDIICEGQAAGGLVKITLNGKHIMKKITIDPALIKPEDIEILEDLILAAHNDATDKLKQTLEEKTKELGKNLSLPEGIKLPF